MAYLYVILLDEMVDILYIFGERILCQGWFDFQKGLKIISPAHMLRMHDDRIIRFSIELNAN